MCPSTSRGSAIYTKIGELVITGFIIAVLTLLLLPAFQQPSGSKHVRSMNNLKWIGLALHNYHDTHGSFPSPAIYSKEGQPLLSWRVSILPFLDENELYSEFRLDEPWDSPNNLSLLSKMPKFYAPPTGKPPKEPFATYYQVFVGPSAAFEYKTTFTFASFTDGT